MYALTFRLLEVFRQVVDCGSVTAASTAMSLSQPTISLQLKKITEIIGMPLLEQYQGTLRMTEAGVAVYQCAQEIQNSQDKLHSQIQALKGMETGALNLAVVTTVKYVIPPLLSSFCKAHPNIDVQFTIGNRAQVIERMENNKDDLYIFSQPPADMPIIATPFQENELVVIAPPDFQGPDQCDLATLANNKFLLREPGSATRNAIDEFCQTHHIKLDNVMMIESNDAIRLAVSSGLGLAILSRHTVAQNAEDQIKILNVEGFPISTYWQVVTLKNRPISPAAESFRDLLIRHSEHTPLA
ncbi:LysR family transcriptional regulator [Alteromonas ponticola]|uniref:LysR family transcriptional regulator n=1 Tax=Alteromonas aquimaris TaxID=2998417 RepID=A0ABT3P5F4_9ALTE|nr:LysR family transcriptional regulator [Alteromonas aquimaris]MCW8107987.1 LysR family transcriptional regulator [Alteromonas aquimaris]